MPSYSFTIRLTSDAEPGTGLGGEVVNDWAPRDHQQRLVIPASHIKGLMRSAYQAMQRSLGWNTEWEQRVFGGAEERRRNIGGAFRVLSAPARSAVEPHWVTRTAIDDQSGVALDKSLRTSEAIPVGTEFVGEVQSGAAANSIEDLAWRLALLTIPAVGGGRNRGSGECVISLEGETRSPGQLLKEIDNLIRCSDSAVTVREVADRATLSARTVVLRLVFRAESPICCPEIPDKTNVLSSGISIPASAVQGVILNRINPHRPDMANALFACDRFRCWPWQPCGDLEDAIDDDLPTSVRVSLTHRVAKYSVSSDDVNSAFHDSALDDHPWHQQPDGAPMKASDGVLLRFGDGSRRLWKASSMRRSVSSHGVHSDPENGGRRNLFTVDAMAPIVWSGLVCLPDDAAEFLCESLASDPRVAIGKNRSVRGIGRLTVEQVDGVPIEWQTFTDRTVLIAQSPLLLGDREAHRSADDELLELATNWARQSDFPTAPSAAWANVGIQFGWNRHEHGRRPAQRVALPGSVIAFAKGIRLDAERLAQVLMTCGLGGGRSNGFGAVCVHPGKALELHQPSRTLRVRGYETNFADALKLVIGLARPDRRLPSASQLRAVQQRLAIGESEEKKRAQALRYLETQLKERTYRVFHAWSQCHTAIRDLIEKFETSISARALESLIDLVVVEDKELRR